MFLASVALAHWLAAFTQKALAFQILLANRAGEALAVVIVVHGFDPTVSSFNREATGVTLGREQLIPVSFAIRQSVLKVEMAIAK